MFGSASSKKKNLEAKYKKLLDESFRLSHIDRKKSDEKAAEADKIRKQLDEIESRSQ